MPSSPWTRFLFWLTLAVLAVAGRWAYELWRAQPPASASVAPADAAQMPHRRPASITEWRQDIAILGTQGKGKRLVWQPLRPSPNQARGTLVWWHDGRHERIGYQPAADEAALPAVMQLMRDLQQGHVVLYNVHGDEALWDRVFADDAVIDANWRLPEGLRILDPPTGVDP